MGYAADLPRRLLDMSQSDREAELVRLQAAYDRFRREHRADKTTRDDWKKFRDGPWQYDYITQDELRFMVHKVNFFTYVDEIDVTQFEALRRHLNENRRGDQPKLTFLPLLITALAKVLRDFPQCNATYDAEREVVVRHKALNVGIAVAPYSPKQTCGACHDYERITSGYHFQQGWDRVRDDFKSDMPWVLSDGMMGKQ